MWERILTARWTSLYELKLAHGARKGSANRAVPAYPAARESAAHKYSMANRDRDSVALGLTLRHRYVNVGWAESSKDYSSDSAIVPPRPLPGLTPNVS